MARPKVIWVDDEGADPMGWMMTFGDLVTLLLTFFVLLLTMSSMDAKTLKDNLADMVTPLELLNSSGNGTFIQPSVVLPSLPKPAEPLRTENHIIYAFEDMMEQMPVDGMTVHTSDKGIVLKFEERVLFDKHQTTLKPGARMSLRRIIPVLERSAFPLIVEGYSEREPLPETSEFENHLELSGERAFKVSQYLLINSKMSQEKMSFRGLGTRQSDGEWQSVELIIDTKTKTVER